MSRAGYSDDIDDNWSLIRWRGQVASAIRGKRGQAFLRELVASLDALPEKRLIAHDLQSDCGVCAVGSVGLRRGIDMSGLDPECYEAVAGAFGIAEPLVREIEFENDEAFWVSTPEDRWRHMRAWAVANLRPAQGGVTEGRDGEAGSGSEATSTRSASADAPCPCG